MTTLVRRAALALALPLALGAPVVLAAAPAEAAVPVTVDVGPQFQSSIYGAVTKVTATVTFAESVPVTTGTVAFSVEGVEIGEFPVNAQGKATSLPLIAEDGTPLDVTFGSDFYFVSAAFHPAPGDDEHGEGNGSYFHQVTPAASATTVSVGQNVIFADVVALAPGGQQAGSIKPGGAVELSVGGHSVGTATITPSGRAAFPFNVSGGSTQLVAAVYIGDDRYTGSSDSVSRSDPTVTAFTFSQSPLTKHGWYRSSVEIIFTCRTPTGATLLGGCPGRAAVRKQGAGQSVTRTVYASDGGVATVVVSGINVDKSAPKISIVGGKCQATDKLSGVAHCKIKSLGDGEFKATARDNAGNRAALIFTRG